MYICMHTTWNAIATCRHQESWTRSAWLKHQLKKKKKKLEEEEEEGEESCPPCLMAST